MPYSHRGAILVPLDYKLNADEQRALLAHAKPKALVIEGGLYRRFDDAPPEIPFVLVSESESDIARGEAAHWDDLPETTQEPPLVSRQRDDIACIVYSSGTGGTPKGCLLSHGNYLSQYEALQSLFELTAGHRYFSVLPTNHAIDFMCGFVGPFGGGATVVHQRTLRPEFVRWTMKEYGITHMALVPLILESFARALRGTAGRIESRKAGSRGSPCRGERSSDRAWRGTHPLEATPRTDSRRIRWSGRTVVLRRSVRGPAPR